MILVSTGSAGHITLSIQHRIHLVGVDPHGRLVSWVPYLVWRQCAHARAGVTHARSDGKPTRLKLKLAAEGRQQGADVSLFGPASKYAFTATPIL